MKDLMIGDWVSISNNVEEDAYFMHDGMERGQAIQVTEILSNGVNPDWYGGEINDYLPDDAIEPIVITEEFLAKNFARHGTNFVLFDDYYDLFIFELSDGMWTVAYHSCEFSIPDEKVHISWVHELQHFMRHCAIEAEIIL